VDVSKKAIIEVNGLKETLEERSPSFVNRFFHDI
jgi:hypothetical protein